MHFTALTLLGALLPLALGMVPEGATVTSNAPSGTASLVAAIGTQYMPGIPAGEAAMPCPPEATARRVHPKGRPDLCLSVQGGQLTSGAELGIHYCAKDEDDKSQWQKWDIRAAMGGNSGTGGQVRSFDTNLCLSIGNDKENAARPHLEKCVDINTNTDTAQRWTLTQEGMKNVKSSKCLDIRGDSFPYTGNAWNSTRDVQVWDCSGNPQQVWTLKDADNGMSGSAPEERKRLLGRRSRV